MAKKRRSKTREKRRVSEIANAFLGSFERDPLPVLEELKEESPYVRLRFLMKVRRVTNRQVAQSAGMNESYFSRSVSTGDGLVRGWQAFAEFFGITKEWLVVGKWKGTPQSLLTAVKGEIKVGESTIRALEAPAKRGAPTWARLLDRTATPIRLGEDAFGFQAGTVVWTEECSAPQMGDRVIAEMKDGSFKAFIMFMPGDSKTGVPAGHTGFPPALRWQDEENLRKATTVPVKDVKKLHLVVGMRDRPLRIRTVNEVMGASVQEAVMLAEDEQPK